MRILVGLSLAFGVLLSAATCNTQIDLHGSVHRPEGDDATIACDGPWR